MCESSVVASEQTEKRPNSIFPSDTNYDSLLQSTNCTGPPCLRHPIQAGSQTQTTAAYCRILQKKTPTNLKVKTWEDDFQICPDEMVEDRTNASGHMQARTKSCRKLVKA